MTAAQLAGLQAGARDPRGYARRGSLYVRDDGQPQQSLCRCDRCARTYTAPQAGRIVRPDGAGRIIRASSANWSRGQAASGSAAVIPRAQTVSSSWTDVKVYDPTTYNTLWHEGSQGAGPCVSVAGGFVMVTYNAGLSSGSATTEIAPNAFGSYDVLRAVYTMRVSSSPAFSQGGTLNKIGFIWVATGTPGNIIFPYLIGGSPSTTAPIQLGIALQGAVTPALTTDYDSGFFLTRGTTYTICTEVGRNTSGNADGYVKLYAKAGAFDGSDVGTLYVNNTAVQFVSGNAAFNDVWIQPSCGDAADVGLGGYSMDFQQVRYQIPS